MRRREECRDREGERRRFFFVLLDESGAGQARGEGRTGSRVEERQRGEREGEREGERRRWKRDRAKKREAGSDDDLARREHEDPKRGQRENDKGERGGRFDWKGRQRGLFPFTSVFSVLRSVLSVVPARARARAHRHTSTSIYTRPNTHIHTRTRVLFPFCPPPLVPPVDLLSYPPSPSTPFSFCHSPRRSAPPFVLFVVAIVRTCARACIRVYVRLVSIVVVREVSCRTALRSRGERAALYVGERENVF